jgi:hypothetical protein
MKPSFWKVLLGGVIFAVIAQIIHMIGAFATMSYYTMPNYLSVWSKIMMPTAGPPPMSFFAYSFLFNLIAGLFLIGGYLWVEKTLKGGAWKKGLYFALLLLIVAGIPGALGMYLIINIPAALFVSWTAEGFVIALLSGAVFAKLY